MFVTLLFLKFIFFCVLRKQVLKNGFLPIEAGGIRHTTYVNEIFHWNRKICFRVLLLLCERIRGEKKLYPYFFVNLLPYWKLFGLFFFPHYNLFFSVCKHNKVRSITLRNWIMFSSFFQYQFVLAKSLANYRSKINF